jgi:23S rRNA pseudouridine1911/1915/1917 synthase
MTYEQQDHQKIYEFTYEWSGERLDIYLTRVQWYTRNFFHRLLWRGDITINNGDVKKKSYILKHGDHIRIQHPERYMEATMLAQSPEVPEVKILLEKDDYVVVHKPPWVLSHPNSVRWVEYPSVVWALYHHFKEMPSIGNFIRAWLIHRLDRETDGLMIIVKTEKWLKHFQRLFHDKSKAATIEEKEKVPLKKCYRATSYILPQWEAFLQSISTPYMISMVVEPKIPFYEPKLWITKIMHVKLLDTKGEWTHKTRDATLDAAKKRHAIDHTTLKQYNIVQVEMEILTWRTHQIRFHLSQHGLPIVGDYLYGWDDYYQMQLQAYKLEFLDPDGEMMTVSL